MIYFLLTRRNSFTVRNFLRSRGSAFSDRIRIIHWEEIGHLKSIRAGTFVFSDLDFLTPPQRLVAVRIFRQLQNRYPHVPVLNNPEAVLLRYDLLKKMAESGINMFTIARANEPLSHLKYPVFIREADRHTGTLTQLLHSETEVKREIKKLNLLGYRSEALLVVEYVDASDGGVFLKYSAFVLGDCVMPRYLNFSHDWNVKSMVSPEDVLMNSRKADVAAYMNTNPHADWLKMIFNTAGITYGRADYALVNGKLQVWEINLNPAFVRPPKRVTKDHQQQRLMRDVFYNRFMAELEKMNFTSDEMVQLTITRADEQQMRVGLWPRIREGFHNRLVKDKLRYRVMRKICLAVAGLLSKGRIVSFKKSKCL